MWPSSPPLTLTHGRQVKDLKKLSVLTFYVAVSLSNIVENFWKHIQKAYYQAVLDKFLIFFYYHPDWENPSRKLYTDPRGFAAVETGFYRGKTSRIRSTTF